MNTSKVQSTVSRCALLSGCAVLGFATACAGQTGISPAMFTVTPKIVVQEEEEQENIIRLRSDGTTETEAELPELVDEPARNVIQLGPASLELPADEQQSLVNDVYQLTRDAKSPRHYTEIIDTCRDAIAKPISSKNKSYLASLASWALNRRGELRYELAMEMADIGNDRESNQVMDSAMRDFDEAVAANPERGRARLCRGLVYARRGQQGQAIEDFSKAIELNPDDAKARFNRAEMLLLRGDHERALKDYFEVTRMNPGDTEAMTGRGHAYFGMAKYEQALAEYETVARLEPSNPISYVNRGDAQQALGNWEKARSDYQEATTFANNGVGYQRLAWLLATCPEIEIFDPGRATKIIEKAIAVDGENATNLDTLAAVQAALGNFEMAQETQQRALALQENQSAAMEERVALYNDRKAYQQAPEPRRIVR